MRAGYPRTSASCTIIDKEGVLSMVRSSVVVIMMFLYVCFTGAVALTLILPFIIKVFARAFVLPRSSEKEMKAFIERVSKGTGIAHRGGRPENTLAAFRRAKAEGASSIEVDLEFTRDGHPVLLHDSTVDRTSSGSGRVADMTLEEIKKLDFGSKYGPEFVGECIPTLYEAVDLCEELDLLLMIDVKNPANALPVLKELFVKQPHLYSRVAAISFWPNFIYSLRRANPNIICGQTYRSKILSTKPDGSRRNKELWKHLLAIPLDVILFWAITTWLWRWQGIRLMLPNKNDILRDRIDWRKWKTRGVYLITWTVNNKEEKQYFNEVVKIPFMTDNPAPDSDAPEQSN